MSSKNQRPIKGKGKSQVNPNESIPQTAGTEPEDPVSVDPTIDPANETPLSEDPSNETPSPPVVEDPAVPVSGSMPTVNIDIPVVSIAGADDTSNISDADLNEIKAIEDKFNSIYANERIGPFYSIDPVTKELIIHAGAPLIVTRGYWEANLQPLLEAGIRFRFAPEVKIPLPL